MDSSFFGVLYQNLHGSAIIDMGDEDYVMTADECAAGAKLVANVGDGTKTLVIPAQFATLCPVAAGYFSTVFAAANFTLAMESTGDTLATGTLTAVDIAAGDTVSIDGLINGAAHNYEYTFVDELTDPAVAYEVLVGATVSDSLDNLIAAINGAAGAGTTYGEGTEANVLVTASAGAGDTMDVESILTGTLGNSIDTTASLTDGSWGGANLSGGVFALNQTCATTDDYLATMLIVAENAVLDFVPLRIAP